MYYIYNIGILTTKDEKRELEEIKPDKGKRIKLYSDRPHICNSDIAFGGLQWSFHFTLLLGGRPMSLRWSGSKDEHTCPETRKSSPSIPQPLCVLFPGFSLTDLTWKANKVVISHAIFRLGQYLEVLVPLTHPFT